MTKPLSITELAALAAQTEDQTVEQPTTFDFEPPEAGVTVGRFIEYIEIGQHPQPAFNGKAKPPVDYVRVTFELLHPTKNIKEYEHEGEKRISGQHVTLKLSKKLGDKAKFKKLFNAMTYGRTDIKHMAQMLGEAFIINIYHNTVKGTNGEKDKTYVNLDKDGAYGISAPFVTDPLEQTKKEVPVREPIRPLRIFLWDNPTKETWESLFIDGTKEVTKDGGEKVEVSKNWLQEVIMSALNYEGSALNAMLADVGDLPTGDEDAPFEGGTVKPGSGAATKATVAKEAAKQAAAKTAAATKTATKDKPAAAKTTKPAAKSGAADDALAALGLG